MDGYSLEGWEAVSGQNRSDTHHSLLAVRTWTRVSTALASRRILKVHERINLDDVPECLTPSAQWRAAASSAPHSFSS